MDCQEVLDQLADYLDRDAREELCRAIEDHLSNCRDCGIEVDTLRKTILLYHTADPTRTIEVPIRVKEQLNVALASEYARNGEVQRKD